MPKQVIFPVRQSGDAVQAGKIKESAPPQTARAVIHAGVTCDVARSALEQLRSPRIGSRESVDHFNDRLHRWADSLSIPCTIGGAAAAYIGIVGFAVCELVGLPAAADWCRILAGSSAAVALVSLAVTVNMGRPMPAPQPPIE